MSSCGGRAAPQPEAGGGPVNFRQAVMSSQAADASTIADTSQISMVSSEE